MIKIKKNKLNINLLNNGAVSDIFYDQIKINQVSGNNLDGSLQNFYFRVQEKGQTRYFRLIDADNLTEVNYSNDLISWQGEKNGIFYRLNLYIGNRSWFWEANITSSTKFDKADLFFVQDLGLGEESFVSSNEAYVSQYIDNFVSQLDKTIIVGSRQNQSQQGRNPYLQIGSFSDLSAFSTDAYQFFGKRYVTTGIPAAMENDRLPSINLQNETNLIVLQKKFVSSESLSTKSIVFYSSFCSDAKGENDHLIFDQDDLRKEFRQLKDKKIEGGSKLKLLKRKTNLSFKPVETEDFTNDEINNIFPARLQEEEYHGRLLSFFTDQNDHVVTKYKEELQTRPTGNIILAGSDIVPGKAILATTQYMSGAFSSQTVFGNTNHNKFSSNLRGPLNFFKMQGMHIYLKSDKDYQLLSTPSLFVMSYNSSDWYYKLKNDVLKISADASAFDQGLHFKILSLTNKTYDLLITENIIMDSVEGQNSVDKIFSKDGRIFFYPGEKSLMKKFNKNLSFFYNFAGYDDSEKFAGDESVFFTENIKDPRLSTFNFKNVSELNFSLAVDLGNKISTNAKFDFTESRKKHRENIEVLLNNLSLSSSVDPYKDQTEKINLIIRWFAHDALVHLLSPHGLEQFGGAAWGTRDVSQGPTELFLSTGNFAYVRSILKILYSHQFREDGNWPQWFMYDEYFSEFSSESHGDMIIWPLKVLVDYIEVSGDRSILFENIPYFDKQEKAFTGTKYSILEHVKKEILYIENHFLYGTKVSAYGDGDWEDTLQPADPKQKQNMASTWTEELTIQVLRKASRILDFNDYSSHIKEIADLMFKDFKKYFLDQPFLPGFISLDKNLKRTNIIFPGDSVTHINYRLIPMTRAIISGIYAGQKAQETIRTIKKELLFPDGVRLMDRPAVYHGGVSKIFKRAEQSANFGREIGLMYTHAHIRYIEALAKTGDPSAWEALFLVDPINLRKVLANSDFRQANVYFSSSDAAFNDRYQAQKDFRLLSKGKIKVKGGWRLYSSGPGIYIKTLISDILGIDFVSGNYNISSSIPKEAGLDIHFKKRFS